MSDNTDREMKKEKRSIEKGVKEGAEEEYRVVTTQR